MLWALSHRMDPDRLLMAPVGRHCACKPAALPVGVRWGWVGREGTRGRGAVKHAGEKGLLVELL